MNAAASIPNKLVVTYYISTGRLNAMYTLRSFRRFEGPMRPGDQTLMQLTDSYICNLAAAGNEELAEQKAAEYVAALQDRIGRSGNHGIEHRFDGDFDGQAMKRRGKLSARCTRNLEAIEAGIFPFGKHAETRIEDAPESYLLYFADKSSEIGETDVVMLALANACMGVALTKGYIARRDVERAKSQHVGTVGERRDFTLTIKSTSERTSIYGYNTPKVQHFTVLRDGDNVFTYYGSIKLGEVGSVVTFKATIKAHGEYKGTKQTQLTRAKVTP